jgi:toxin ParE1/3/4
MRLILSEDAESDLREISRYTRDRWGPERARSYVWGLRDKLTLLCAHPQLGPVADEVRPGLRRCSYLNHNAFYRAGDDYVRIIRILHKHMLAQEYLR